MGHEQSRPQGQDAAAPNESAAPVPSEPHITTLLSHTSAAPVADAVDAVKLVHERPANPLRDEATSMLDELPAVQPLLPATLEIKYLSSSSGFSNPNIRAVDPEAALNLLLRFQATVREEAQAAASNQRMLTLAVRDTETRTSACLEEIARKERVLLRLSASLREVVTIGKALSQTREMAFRISESMQAVNAFLPPLEQLEEFDWAANSAPSAVKPTNP